MPEESVTILPGWERYACAFLDSTSEDEVTDGFNTIMSLTMAEKHASGIGAQKITRIEGFYSCEFWLFY